MTLDLESNGPSLDTEIGATQNPCATERRIMYPPSALPSGDSVVFKDSSFFRRNCLAPVLPSPADVLAEADRRNGGVEKFTPLPVHYPELGLTVKYGRTVSITEGQCLWAVRHLLGDAVPVPEVYGWTREEDTTYIYMEHIPGDTLRDRWESLSEVDRQEVCRQLRTMVARIRTLEPPPGDRFIGTICRQPLLDLAFITSGSPPMGPFTDVTKFHDLFVKLPCPQDCDPGDPPHPFRNKLPDDVPVIFTHGDLHRGNVIISSAAEGGSPRVKSIIDWGQAGWYPSYWEYCKARWTALRGEEWDVTYIPLFLDKFDCFDYWDYYLLTMGV